VKKGKSIENNIESIENDILVYKCLLNFNNDTLDRAYYYFRLGELYYQKNNSDGLNESINKLKEIKNTYSYDFDLMCGLVKKIIHLTNLKKKIDEDF